MSDTLRFQWRYYALCLAFVLATVALVYRVVSLQLVDSAQGYRFLQREGDLRSVRLVSQPAPRGDIVDRNGASLAVSTPVYTVGVNPQALISQTDGIAAMADILEEPAEGIYHYLKQRQGRQFIPMRRHVPPDKAKRLMALRLNGVRVEPGFRRFYPAGELVSQIVGYNNDVENFGIEGVERMFDTALQPVAGQKRVLRDLSRSIVRELDLLQEPVKGQSIALSLDLKVQYMAYTALAQSVTLSQAKSGSAVFVNRRTGEVLAMANYPSFNPNNRQQLDYQRVRNRAVTDILEPGSTIKPFTVLAALELGTVEVDTIIDTSPGWIVVDGKTLKDFRDYGDMDLTTVLAKSSQVGATKIALQTDPFALRGIFERLGFGQQVGLGLPGEAGGILPYHKRWPKIDRATMAFGHGLAISTLQLAQAYQILANDGVKVPLTILAQDNAKQGEAVVSPEHARAVREMLAATFKKGGTASSSRLSVYELAGKTGTAHKVGGEGYLQDRYRALFAGFAPASDPEIVGVVVIDEPSPDRYYGGEVAAPVFAQVSQQVLPYLGVQPLVSEEYDTHAKLRASFDSVVTIVREGV